MYVYIKQGVVFKLPKGDFYWSKETVLERFQRDLKSPFFLGLLFVVAPEAPLSLRLVSFRVVDPRKVFGIKIKVFWKVFSNLC